MDRRYNHRNQCFDVCVPVEQEKKGWSALYDNASNHPCFNNDGDISQGAAQTNKTLQIDEDFILIKDSCDVEIHTTDTKAAVNLQAALQLALVLVISITVGDSFAEEITEELIQSSKVKQKSVSKTIIENSRGVDITATDTQVSINIQILLQLLIAILVIVDIL
uniref:spore coat protein n=1 Tax=Bacillaceae bacterium JMAK1 TaxID=1028381 RepID=UPI00155DA4DE|nr:spore coat protein [Bacillaceae bacterium JMAK1]